MKIDLTNKEKVILGLIGISIMILPSVFTRELNFIDFTHTGGIGDTIGGITAPFMSFFGSILVYLALKSQVDANDEIKKQFEKQKTDESNDFIYSNFKERINIVISEINSFNISFHENTLISNIEKLPSKQGKKYNFIGLQALNLFLLEYFRLLKENQILHEKDIILDNSYHAIFININAIINLFYKTHRELTTCYSLDDKKKEELRELLRYVYFSKL